MKRALALLVTLLMVVSLFPLTALAEGESTDTPEPVITEETATPEPTVAPEGTPTPEPIATPEPTATEALASESPSAEALFLRFLDCDTLDADGAGHMDVPCLAGDALELQPKTESNGALSYRWQMLDQGSEAEDPYVDISTSDEPTADEMKLSTLAEASMIGIADYYRCVVTATLGDETLVSYCYFTLESSAEEPAPTPELAMMSEGMLDAKAEGAIYYATSMLDIQYALGNSTYTTVFCNGNIEITSTLNIPSDKMLYIMGNDYTLTISSGVTVNNSGTIAVDSMGHMNIDGTLNNMGVVWSQNGGSINVSSGGSYQASGSDALLLLFNHTASGIAQITGVDDSEIFYMADAYDEEDLSALLDYSDDAEYGGAEVYLKAAVEIFSDLTIPSGVTLYLEDNLTIDSSATLTINGSLQVLSGITLVNNGAIVNNGELKADGSFINNGTISGSGTNNITGTASTEAQLRDALAAGKNNITVTAGFTLAANLTIPAGVQLNLTGGTVAVPSGLTLTVNGSVDLDSPVRLIVKSGATLKNNGLINVVSGTLIVETGAVYSGSYAELYLYVNSGSSVSGASITGIKAENIVAVCLAENDSAMRTALSYGGKDYKRIEIYLLNSFSLASNLVLTPEMSLFVGLDGSGIVLTVPTGRTLTNNGYVEVHSASTLWINARHLPTTARRPYMARW
ncbi:MAG: hypothetical protein VB062_09340 [Christensenella sp.]|nr:hypothetical protein [Christensenella sp.]